MRDIAITSQDQIPVDEDSAIARSGIQFAQALVIEILPLGQSQTRVTGNIYY